MKNKLVIVFSVISTAVFLLFWWDMGGSQFFEFLQNPTSEWQFFDYIIVFMFGSAAIAWIKKIKRNKVKNKVKTVYEKLKPRKQEKVEASNELSIPQKSINQLEKTRKIYIWIFLIASAILFYKILTGMVLNLGITMNGESSWSYSRIGMMLFWLVPSVFLGAFLQWRYTKQYNDIYVDSVLNNLQDIDAHVIDQSPKNIMKKYLPGMPYGQIKGSETLVLVTDQYSAQAVAITIERNNNTGGGGA